MHIALPARLLAVAVLAAFGAAGCQRESPDQPAPAPEASAATDADADAATSAPAAPSPPSAPATASAFDCGGTTVQATLQGDSPALVLEGETIALTAVPAASGARFEGTRADGTAVAFWSKGESATLAVAGSDYPECVRAAPATDAAAATPGAVYRARGNEPFWSIEIRDGALRWSTADAPEPVLFAANDPVYDAESFTLSSATVGSDAPARALAMSAEKALCRDSMSGMPFPQTVTVRVDDVEYRGCGGEPITLLAAHEWTVASLDGSAVAGRAPTLSFSADGRVAGFAGCNRWGSGATLTGEGLSFGAAFATKMACAEPGAMETEQAFLAALPKVTRHDFDETGALLLKAGDTAVIVATPTPATAAAPQG